jgi:hypothetical protein
MSPLRFALRHLLMGIPLLLLACTGPADPSDVWQEQLDYARERWEQSGPASYAFRYTRQCFCPQLSLHVTVTNGVVTAIRDLTADTMFTAPVHGYTIPALFDQVQEFIDRPVSQLTASYDVVTGAPLSVAADPIANAIDDENGFTVSEFAANP